VLAQERDRTPLTRADISAAFEGRDVPSPDAQRDLLIAAIVARHSAARSACAARDGVTLGVVAGAPSEHRAISGLVRAVALADARRSPEAATLAFRPGTTPLERVMAVEWWLDPPRPHLAGALLSGWLAQPPPPPPAGSHPAGARSARGAVSMPVGLPASVGVLADVGIDALVAPGPTPPPVAAAARRGGLALGELGRRLMRR
jgi:AICAR transformylase/IMP cyclohydrolase PurH